MNPDGWPTSTFLGAWSDEDELLGVFRPVDELETGQRLPVTLDEAIRSCSVSARLHEGS